MNCKEIKNIITTFIRDEVKKTGLNNVVIGLSGGVDSSVVATLAVEALGKDRVYGVLMPSSESTILKSENFKDALELAKSLDIITFVIPVSDMLNTEGIHKLTMDSYMDNMDEFKLRCGNIKARTRMIILYDLAMQLEAIVLGTTNKIELLLGYLTKYGDGGVDIEPIVDIYKTEVFRLARYINVSENIVNKPPSAELWDGQTDEDELGMKYSEIDQVLWWLIEEEYDARKLEKELDILTSIKDKTIIKKILNIMSKNYHKTCMPKSCKIGNIDIRTTIANDEKGC